MVQEIESDISRVQKDREAKQKAMGMDYGPERVFYMWKDKCISKHIEVRGWSRQHSCMLC